MKIQISFVSILNLYNLDNKIQITKMIKKILYSVQICIEKQNNIGQK